MPRLKLTARYSPYYTHLYDMFISFDGIDGGGKSTQIDMLIAWLTSNGHSVELCRDPGTTDAGEAIREIILHKKQIDINAITEMLLYMAARAQLVRETISPAVAAGKTVVCDRFLLASIVYQGCGGGVPTDVVSNVGEIATGGLQPDFTIVLDLPVDTAQSRLGTEKDRMESRSIEYFEAVRSGFLSYAPQFSKSYFIADATLSPDALHQQILGALQPHLGC